MTGFVVKNNIESLVVDSPLAVGATTLNVTPGTGSRFPSTFPFIVTIWDEVTYPDPTDDSGMEVTYCTGRTVDALTISRGEEGTADVSHTSGSRAAMLITEGHFNATTYGLQTQIDAITCQKEVLTKTNDYTVVADDLCKSLRMNSAIAKTFTFPSVGASDDGTRITIMKIGAGRVTLQMVDTDKIHDSSATGTMYNEEATETYARVDAEYCHTTTTWNVVASGTWITT